MHKKPRIVFMGTPAFATTILKKLVDEGYPVKACVTTHDKPAGRGRKVQQSDVKKFAIDAKINVLQPENLKEEHFIQNLKDINADLFVVVAFRMLPRTVWELPPMGTINLHGSLLPEYRGAAPINWSIINGEKETGVTTFFINEKIDTGDILLQKRIPIKSDETAGTLHDKMMHIGADLVVETVEGLTNKTLQASQQETISNSFKPAPKIFKPDCKIDFNLSPEQLDCFIRGLSPYPGAWLTLLHRPKNQKKSFKIFFCKPANFSTTAAPQLKIEDEKLVLAWQKGTLELLNVQLEGKKRLTIKEFLTGFDPKDWQIIN